MNNDCYTLVSLVLVTNENRERERERIKEKERKREREKRWICEGGNFYLFASLFPMLHPLTIHSLSPLSPFSLLSLHVLFPLSFQLCIKGPLPRPLPVVPGLLPLLTFRECSFRC